MNEGICKLCDEQKKLVSAHIIPKWAEKDIKEGHMVIVARNGKNRKIQSGFQDTKILCKDCDGTIIGRYEKYAKEFLTQNFSEKIIRTKGPKGTISHILVKDADAAKLRIFFCSVLWRASISFTKEYQHINLGNYENIAKAMIRSGTISNENIFQVVLQLIEPSPDGFEFEKSIMPPTRTRYGNAICYGLMVAGFHAIIKVSEASSPIHVEGLKLQSDVFPILVTKFEESFMPKKIQLLRAAIRDSVRA